jgi:hypothetical protein
MGVSIFRENGPLYGKFYQQKRGTAMGTKMAPTYATLVLGYLEHILYEQLLNRSKLMSSEFGFTVVGK